MTTLGEIGYQAYGNYTGGLNFRGEPMPRWEDLPDTIRGAWEYATQAVQREIFGSGTLRRCGRCGHGEVFHDHDEGGPDVESARCCVDGCGCGERGELG